MALERTAYLAEPRGFCTGVKAAIETVEKALVEGPLPVCVLHEIVHNEHVVEALARRGVRFIERLEDAPPGSTLIFSAHGVSKAVEDLARSMPVRVLDATCPLVKSLQAKAAAFEAQGLSVILIGHKDHSEVAGVVGRLEKGAQVVLRTEEVERLEPSDAPCACLSQTTLNSDDVERIVAKLRVKRPSLTVGGGVCYATRDRQEAVKRLALHCDTILVLGSERSSNSKRLKEVAESTGAKAHLVAAAANIPEEVLADAMSIGVTAGASAPEELVQETLRLLTRKGFKICGQNAK